MFPPYSMKFSVALGIAVLMNVQGSIEVAAYIKDIDPYHVTKEVRANGLAPFSNVGMMEICSTLLHLKI